MRGLLCSLLAGAAVMLMGVAPAAAATTFSNSQSISIPETGVTWPSGIPGEGDLVPAAATPFPSIISVSGLSGVVSKVTLTLNLMNHTYPADLDMMLVSPDGKKVMVWSDAGGARTLTNVTVTLDDDASILPEFLNGFISSSYHPWNYYNDSQFPAPAPPMGFGVLDAFSGDIPKLSTFNGSNPNGTWGLYVVDDADGQGGSIAGGWSLSVTTVPGAPIVTTAAAGPLSTTGATLNGTFNPNGEPTTYHFEYGPTDAYGSSTASTSGGAGTAAVAAAAPITGLVANSDYHFRLVATNGTGTTTGSDQTFKTPPDPPVATTGAPTAVTQTGATLNASVNPSGAATTYRFEYGTTPSYGSTTAGTSAGDGTSAAPVSTPVTGLAPGTTYHVRVVATSAGGTTNGGDQVFTTAAEVPTTTTTGTTTTTTPPGPDPTVSTPGIPTVTTPSITTPTKTRPLVATITAAKSQRKQARFTISLSRAAKVGATLRDARGRSYGVLSSRSLTTGRHTLTITLSSSTRRRLAKLRSVRVTLTVTATPKPGAAVTRRGTITLRP